LIFDGYGSHLTKEFVDYCDECKIIPFSLPPHTSHNLQPCDVVVFQPFKHYHKQAVEAATRTGCTDFNKVEFLNAIDSIRRQTFKKRTILSAWEQAGLYPYNPKIVHQKLESSRPQTLQPVICNMTINLTTPTPTTVRSYKQWSMKLRKAAELGRPVNKYRLLKYLDVADANMALWTLAEEDLTMLTAAARQCTHRQTTNQKVVQKGRVISGCSARAAIDARVEAEAQKAGRAAARRYKQDVQRTATEASEPATFQQLQWLDPILL
jgi:hypothetical protein